MQSAKASTGNYTDGVVRSDSPFCTAPFAEENQSIHKFMTKNYGWETDSSHIVHVGTRCATVMDSAIWRLSADNRDNVKSIAKKYKTIGDVYLDSTASLVTKINYKSDGYFIKLFKSWMDSYKAMGDENAILYNDFFHGMHGEDFKTCMEQKNIQFFKGILEDAAKN